MKIKFDAQKLISQIQLAKSALPMKSSIPTEEELGIKAANNQLTVYAYTKNQWVKIIIAGTVEEEGYVIVNRQRFFNLVSLLKGEVKIQTVGTQIKITTNEQAGKFSMTTGTALVPQPRAIASLCVVSVESKKLLHQLQQCTLDEELAGGGFKVSFGSTLDILSTDRIRLIDSHQKMDYEYGKRFDMMIPSESIKGVMGILKLSGEGKTQIEASSNITSWRVDFGSEIFEYGSVNISKQFPDSKRITELKNYPNLVSVEVADLLEAVKRITVLAYSELAWADFDFFDPETCVITTEAVEGSSEVKIPTFRSEIEQESTRVLRLQLNHVQSFMQKAHSQGVEDMFIEWGEKLPVRFTPDIEEPEKQPEIEVTYICAALQRPIAKEAKA